MFWNLFREELLVQMELSSDERTRAWRARKDRLDMTTGRTWPIHNLSQDALSARKFFLHEFWHIFVDDRPVHRCAINTHANAPPNSVFSFALAILDKICGWEQERKWVGSLLVECVWIFIKAVLCNGQQPPENELQGRMLSIMQSVNGVCEDAFNDEHEWVTQITVPELESRALADLDYNFEIPCMVQCGWLWFSAPSRSDQSYEDNGTQLEVYHEVTNMAIRT